MKITIVKNVDDFITIFNSKDSIIVPIIEKTDVVILFIYIEETIYVLNFWHDDLYTKLVFDKTLLVSNTKKFIHNKFKLFNLLPLKNSYEIRLFYYLSLNQLPVEVYNNGRKHYDKLYKELNNNYIMPFSVLCDYAWEIIKYYKDFVNNNQALIETEAFKAYNSIYLELNNYIRNNGVLAQGIKYSLDYNFYTTTGRPMLNKNKQFLSIKAGSDFKKSIVSRYDDGKLLYYDYISSHIYILADILNIKFDEDPYMYFSKIIFNKPKISKKERDDIKVLLFSILYRENIPFEFFKIEFFKKVDRFANKLFKEINTKGYFETHFFKKKIYKESLSKQRKNIVLNYYVSSYETERNVILLNKVIKYIKDNDLKTKLILYIYDGFLFDYSVSDGKEIVLKIKEIMNDNKYDIGLEYGDNFEEVKKLKI